MTSGICHGAETSESIVNAMLSRLGRGNAVEDKFASDRPLTRTRVPLPKIKKKFTQRDRDLFLRNSFTVIKQFFGSGLEELKDRDPEVDIDLAEVTKFKFNSTIYLKGEVAARCKIWIGGMSASDSIAYLEGQSRMDSDNSFNDMLSVADDEQALGLKPSGMWFEATKYTRDELLTAEEAAEYLWLRFTKAME
jgi:hypothetical protein